MNYETLAIMDVVVNSDDLRNRILEAYSQGMSIDDIAGELQLFFEGSRPIAKYDVYNYLLEHALEQADYRYIVQSIVSE